MLFNKEVTNLMQYPLNANSISYVIPAHVINVYFFAFTGCNNLKNITITSNVISMGCLFMCGNLVTITVEEENLNYKSIAGVLFNKEGNELIHYPAGNTRSIFIIPSSVTKISGTFAFCNNLTTIYIDRPVSEGIIEYMGDIIYNSSITAIYVNDHLSEEYYRRIAPWSKYSNIIRVRS